MVSKKKVNQFWVAKETMPIIIHKLKLAKNLIKETRLEIKLADLK